MELKEFIETTLLDVIDGVKNAQEKGIKKDAIVSPSHVDGAFERRRTEYNGKDRIITNIDFEVGLTSSDGVEGKAGIGVFLGNFSAGASKKTDIQNISVTNIKFSVSVALPCIETKSTTHFSGSTV